MRLLATDLDGTLWDRTCEVRPDIAAAIAELLRRTALAVSPRSSVAEKSGFENAGKALSSISNFE